MKGQMRQGLFFLSSSADWGMCPTSDMPRCRIESPFLSLQAVDKLFSQEVYLLPWGHFWARGCNLHRDKKRKANYSFLSFLSSDRSTEKCEPMSFAKCLCFFKEISYNLHSQVFKTVLVGFKEVEQLYVYPSDHFKNTTTHSRASRWP